MAPEVQSQSGSCPTHDTVTATREIPKIQFPFVYYAVLRAFASRRPFRCPRCGSQVQAS